jgi:phosphate transport system protein
VEITNLEKMKDISITMLQKGLDSFINGDIKLAKEVGELDEEVDNYSDETYKTITSYLKEHPEETDHLVQLLLINRYLERTADHITNIAESAAYLIKCQMCVNYTELDHNEDGTIQTINPYQDSNNI